MPFFNQVKCSLGCAKISDANLTDLLSNKVGKRITVWRSHCRKRHTLAPASKSMKNAARAPASPNWPRHLEGFSPTGRPVQNRAHSSNKCARTGAMVSFTCLLSLGVTSDMMCNIPVLPPIGRLPPPPFDQGRCLSCAFFHHHGAHEFHTTPKPATNLVKHTNTFTTTTYYNYNHNQ